MAGRFTCSGAGVLVLDDEGDIDVSVSSGTGVDERSVKSSEFSAALKDLHDYICLVQCRFVILHEKK